MDPGNCLCSVCRRSAAKFFCCCTDPETLLCEGCLGKHISEGLMIAHQTRPISILPYYKNPRSMERMTALDRVRKEALKSIEDVDRAIEEIVAKVPKIIAALHAHCEKQVAQLQKIKTALVREIPLGLEEVKRTLAEERPLLTAQFGPLFREYTEKTAPLQLFSYTIETCPPQDLLRLHSHIATSRNLSCFTGVYEDKVFLYDVGAETIANHSLSVNFGKGGSYVELDKERLLCVGADQASSAVYLLDLLSFQLSPLPSLSTPRRDAGIAKVNARIYLFGGADALNTGLRSCEKMDLSGKWWSDMKSMTYPRGGFTPCRFLSRLFLVSCWFKHPLEAFNIETETFVTLPIYLPSQLTLGGGSVAFMVNDELCVLTDKKQMLLWNIDREWEFRLSSTGEIIWSLQEPIAVGSLLLIASSGGVTQFSLETFSYVKRIV